MELHNDLTKQASKRKNMMKTQLVTARGNKAMNLFLTLMIEFNSKALLERGAKHTETQKRYIAEEKICGIIEETIHRDGEQVEAIYEVALSPSYAGFIQYMLDNIGAKKEASQKKVLSSRPSVQKDIPQEV